jgi:hypothetical protein
MRAKILVMLSSLMSEEIMAHTTVGVPCRRLLNPWNTAVTLTPKPVVLFVTIFL